MKTLREIRDDDYAQFVLNEGWYVVYTGKLSDFFMKEVINQLRNKTSDKHKLSKSRQKHYEKLIKLVFFDAFNKAVPYSAVFKLF